MNQTRVTTPTVLQMEATECGAAALGIVLAYYKRYVSLEALRVECGVSRDGSKAINILQAARHYGLEAQGAKAEELDDLTTVTLPVILFWEFNHFVVLEGIFRDTFYINDPATGPRLVERQEFNRSFTGVLLLLKPGPNFKTGGCPLSTINSLFSRLKGYTLPLIFIFLTSLGLVIPGVAISGFSKIFIDEILIRHVQGWLSLLLLGMVLTAIVRGVLTWIEQTYLLRLQIKLAITATMQFMWHVLSLPISFFQQRYAGDVTERVGANDRISTLLSEELNQSLIAVFVIGLYALVMALLDWQLASIVMVAAIMNFYLLYAISRKMTDTSRLYLQQDGKLAGTQNNILQNIETIKASGLEANFFRRWAGLHAQTINSQQNILYYQQLLTVVSGLLMGLVTVAVLSLGSWKIMRGQFTVGGLVAFQSLMVSFSLPIITLLGMGNQMQKIRGDLVRLDDVIQHPEDPYRTHESVKIDMIPKIARQVAFRDIRFGYSPVAAPVIDHFDLVIPAGQSFALIGATASGKSTLAKLLAGLNKPWSGEILVDDSSLRHFSTHDRANIVGMVAQEIYLFEGSVKDNLSLWDSSVSTEQMERALKWACIDDVIHQRGGLGMHVEEAGLNFSGGQRQRLEIARALVHVPSVLILDEATASLDPQLEKNIYENLRSIGCTLLVIAHRLSAIRDCDQILLFDQGQIVARGTHESLMNDSKQYQQLIRLD